MNRNRLSATLSEALNRQMTREALAAQIYLSYGAWSGSQGYDGIARFLLRHAQEERNHMMKFMEYILKRGSKAVVEAIPAPPADPGSVNDCFEKVFQHEVENTRSVYALAKMSMDEQDWATWHFIQYFVKEQTEEENLAIALLDKMRIAGGENATLDALYALDKDLEKDPGEARMAEDSTESNP